MRSSHIILLAGVLGIWAASSVWAAETPLTSAAAPPAEAQGADADRARAWLLGAWTMHMTPPPGQEDPGTITMTLAAENVVKIAFPDQDNEELGAWRVTGATATGASVLLDEDQLDADPEDDVYLELTYDGADRGTGFLHSATGPEADKVDVTIDRKTASRTPEAKPEPTPDATPVAPEATPPAVVLSDSEPSSVAGAIASIQKAGMNEGATFGVAAVDLNGDGKDEALVKVTHANWCSGDMDKCRIFILQRDEKGDWQSLGYPYAKAVAVLDTATGGWRDLAFDGVTYVKGDGGYAEKPAGP